jgi:hypothetical protein
MPSLIALLLLLISTASFAQTSGDSLNQLVQKQIAHYKSNKAVGGMLALTGGAVSVIAMNQKVSLFGESSGMPLGTALAMLAAGITTFIIGTVVFINADTKMNRLRKNTDLLYNQSSLGVPGQRLSPTPQQLSLVVRFGR